MKEKPKKNAQSSALTFLPVAYHAGLFLEYVLFTNFTNFGHVTFDSLYLFFYSADFVRIYEQAQLASFLDLLKICLKKSKKGYLQKFLPNLPKIEKTPIFRKIWIYCTLLTHPILLIKNG
jgi:hypothetical protein